MRLFWFAWGAAISLIVVAVAATAWVLSVSESWSLLPFVIARILCVIIGLMAFVGAFRLALLGTVALRHLLARNLAIVIAMELGDLRQAMQMRAVALADGGVVAAEQVLDTKLWRSAEPQRFPTLLGNRDEVRKLLGKATEHTLEQVLISLRAYHDTVLEADLDGVRGPDSRERARRDVWRQIGVVQDRIAQATNAVAPFCRPSLLQAR